MRKIVSSLARILSAGRRAADLKGNAAAVLAAAALFTGVFSPEQASAADPMATSYSPTQCLGTAMPYPAPDGPIAIPDSLEAMYINHVGRHGARYLSSMRPSVGLLQTLAKADSVGVLTDKGKQLKGLVEYVIDASHGRWGALDSLGMAEQRGIATRMFRAFPRLFDNGRVHAISSYSPRCVMSMYEFCHQLDRVNNSVEITTSAGRTNSPLMRPFDTDRDFVEWFESHPWQEPYDMCFQTTCPAEPARRLISDKNYLTHEQAVELSWSAYSVVHGLPAMGLDVDITTYFTPEELNALWACENLGHYLKRSASTLSLEPAYVASNLLLDLINTTDEAAQGKRGETVSLRFGHAETLLPLLSLMRLPGCYYMTNYFDTVGLHWRDFTLTPMAANLQMVLLRSKKGVTYLLILLNERPIALPIGAGSETPEGALPLIPWSTAKEYLNLCLPIHMQI